MKHETEQNKPELQLFLEESDKNKYWYMLLAYFILVSPLIRGTLKIGQIINRGSDALAQKLQKSDQDQNDSR